MKTTHIHIHSQKTEDSASWYVVNRANNAVIAGPFNNSADANAAYRKIEVIQSGATKDESTDYKGHKIVQEGTTWGPDGKSSVPQYIISGPSIKGRMSGFNSLQAAKARIDSGTVHDAEQAITYRGVPIKPIPNDGERYSRKWESNPGAVPGLGAGNRPQYVDLDEAKRHIDLLYTMKANPKGKFGGSKFD